jgi:hypothetical protein
MPPACVIFLTPSVRFHISVPAGMQVYNWQHIDIQKYYINSIPEIQTGIFFDNYMKKIPAQTKTDSEKDEHHAPEKG